MRLDPEKISNLPHAEPTCIDFLIEPQLFYKFFFGIENVLAQLFCCSKSHGKFLHHINHQKLKVQEEAEAVFGTDACPRNGEVPQIEPLCNAKASHERITSIQFMLVISVHSQGN